MVRLPPISARHLAEYASGYVEAVTALSYRDIERQQKRPHASVAFGAAGIAYALWRGSQRLGRPELLAPARRWIADAWRARSARDAFASADLPRADWRGSTAYGPAGVALVAALIAPAREAAAWRDRFRRAAVTAPKTDLLFGAAGAVSGAHMLLAHRRASRADLRAAASRLAERRLDTEWRAPSAMVGMAHGLAGMCFVLLQAATRSPAWLLASLDRLAALATPVGRGLRWPYDTSGAASAMPASWCNGSAGMAILWAKAYEVTGDARHRRLARLAALDTYDHMNARPDLCCGCIGMAYAMLALSRVDPGRGWRRKAHQLATLALVTEVETEWPHGLLKGEPGLFCLAVDLLARETRFPLFEA